jgi:hypothetical protein
MPYYAETGLSRPLNRLDFTDNFNWPQNRRKQRPKKTFQPTLIVDLLTAGLAPIWIWNWMVKSTTWDHIIVVPLEGS